MLGNFECLKTSRKGFSYITNISYHMNAMKRTRASMLAANIEEQDPKSAMKRANVLSK